MAQGDDVIIIFSSVAVPPDDADEFNNLCTKRGLSAEELATKIIRKYLKKRRKKAQADG